jgi:preprotein translocase subunit SecA
MYDLDMAIDVQVEYHYDRRDKFIELTSVKWYGTEILEHISDKAYDKIIDHVKEKDLWRHEE